MNNPLVQDLRTGAILYSIAHAIFTAAHPFLAYEVWWDGMNYVRSDTQGTYGAITFKNDAVVGVFFDHESPRSPYNRKRNSFLFSKKEKEFDIDRYFRGIEPHLYSIVQTETLPYRLEEFRGKVVPMITTAFWSSGDYLVGAESWDNIFKNGAFLVKIELLPTYEAMPLIEEDYEFTTKQMDLLASVFNRRMGTESPITLRSDELQVLLAEGREGIEASKTLLKSINISLGVI
ncbi:MAG: hypothetical protein DPW16_02770 [Chloroflexi bacterium]|nr:hypothetical protein [Chloroflexota bacterium]